MPKRDPYDPGETKEYECANCGNRVRAESHPGTCQECGGELVDVSVPRE